MLACHFAKYGKIGRNTFLMSNAGFEAVGMADNFTKSINVAFPDDSQLKAELQQVLAEAKLDGLVDVRNPFDVSNGDARSALSTLEMVVLNGEVSEEGIRVSDEIVAQCLSRKNLMYDKDGEEHYNLISALHKSMRNSDPDAAVYWMMRMLEGGEDPLYIARRVLRFAAEDVGLADPRAMEVGVAAYQACHFIGVPECNVHLAEAVVYMSLASKSNAVYSAVLDAREAIEKEPDAPVPLVIRNAPTDLMRNLSYGKGYQYAHDYAEKITAMQCLPDVLKDRKFYRPTTQGQEARYKERLEQIEAWKKEHRKG